MSNLPPPKGMEASSKVVWGAGAWFRVRGLPALSRVEG